MLMNVDTLGQEIQPYVEPMLQRLFMLIVNPNVQRTLLENVAITIGRLGLVCPQLVSPHLPVFITPWLSALIPICSNDEKASAFSGLCEMIKVNPQGCKDIGQLATAVATYVDTPPSLAQSFGEVSWIHRDGYQWINLVYHLQILTGYKNMIGEEQWTQLDASMQPPARALLRERYGV